MLDFYRFSHFQKYPTLLHAVSKKSDVFPYGFSLALHTGEDTKNIIANRNTLATQLQSTQTLNFIVANQTHSDHIAVIRDKQTKGWHTETDAVKACDALITNIPNVVLSILTADCVPILLYDPKQKVVAAIHAGWKGTQAQIASKTVQKMKELFLCDAQDIMAGIAPSIGQCCYEVGVDVAQHFFDTPKGFTSIGEKYMLGLPYINKQQLLNIGLQEKHIEMSDTCTACEVEDFFSYRKEKGCSGRFMSMLGLKEQDED